jgi:hypothetical protein
MAQNTTILPTGTRAFNAIAATGAEDVIIFVPNGEGGQLSLEAIDGTVSASTVAKMYAVNVDGSATQIGQTTLAAGNFSQTFKGGLYATVQEFLNQKISLKGAANLGLLNSSGIRITVTAVAATTIALGASLDRRVDGSF